MKKNIIFDYNETENGIEQLIEVIKWLGGYVEDIAKDTGGTFTHLVVSKNKLNKKQIANLKKRNGIK